jgi:hypothetical protein
MNPFHLILAFRIGLRNSTSKSQVYRAVSQPLVKLKETYKILIIILVEEHDQSNVEQLIDELKAEYNLTEADVTKLKFDLDKTLGVANKSVMNWTKSSRIDKEVLKNNLFLSLINQKVARFSEKSSNLIKRKNSIFSNETSISRSEFYKKRRMGFKTSLFGKLIS